MRRFGIILLAILLLLALVGFAAKRVLLDTASVPPRSRMVIDLGVLRGLAQAPASTRCHAWRRSRAEASGPTRWCAPRSRSCTRTAR